MQESTARLQAAQAAWQVLQDVESRREYDRSLAQGVRLFCYSGTMRHWSTHTVACGVYPEAQAASRAVVVSVEIDIDDMAVNDSTGVYTYPCRCGDEYQVSCCRYGYVWRPRSLTHFGRMYSWRPKTLR